MTKEECCAKAQEMGADTIPKTETTPEQKKLGTVICCEGRLVSCVWMENMGPLNRKTPKTKWEELIQLCAYVHEDFHKDNHMKPCADKILRGASFNVKKRGDEDPLECDAYKRQFECMTTKMEEWCAKEKEDDGGPTLCKNRIKDALDNLKRGANNSHKCGFEVPPIPGQKK
jgi:hypothetical protein